jgi:predicted lipoprotein with Yx(FWY)xxD motif
MGAALAASLLLAGCGEFRGVVQGASETGDGYGAPLSPPPPAPAPGDGAPGNGEPVAVTALRISATGRLGDLVVDNAGRTLYRFDRDRARPSATACTGACARMWPPVRFTPSLQVAGAIGRARIGQVRRPDGTLQLTLAGRPLYRYARDAAPGDASGQGVNGAWYAARPDGTKATAGSGPLPPGFGPGTGGSASGGDGGIKTGTPGSGSPPGS